MGDEVARALVRVLGGERVRTDEEERRRRRHDTWVLSHLDDLQGRPAPMPAAVVRPTTVEEVVSTVRLCAEHGAPIVPFGLGSGVCGGVLASSGSVVVDLGGLDRTRRVDPVDLLASFDAGVRGIDAERAVEEHGLTLGHWPQSIELSSVGGWVATRASGQFSTAYGNVEDILYSVEAVLADGSVVTAGKAPRAAAGPDLRQLFLGSEGIFGLITGVTFSLRRRPERRACSAFHAPSMAAGFEAQREIVQGDWLPPVMRLYDERETARNFSSVAREGQGLLLMVHEGPTDRVEAELRAVTAIAGAAGLDSAPAEVVEGWLEHRNQVPTWEVFLDKGIVLDTVEISAEWSRIGPLYDAVVQALGDVPGILAATAHSSHVYRSGINLYFTFAARPEDPATMAEVYRQCWRRIMEVTVSHGGGIAHHHGIGRVRREWLRDELGDAGVGLLRSVKDALDPRGLLNPGVLLPDE